MPPAPPDATPPHGTPAPKGGAKRGLACLVWSLLAAVLLTVLGLVGGFFGLRVLENNHLRDGQAALEAGSWAEAEAAFDQALAVQPPGVRVHVLEATVGRGIARYHQEKADGALSDFEAVLALDPARAEPYYYRAAIYFARQELPAALEAAAAALERDDSLGLPYAIQAYDHWLKFDVKAARTAADAALARDDSLALAYRVRGILKVWDYELEAALEDLDSAIRLDPLDVQALAARVYVQLELEDSSQAEADVNAALAADPGAADSLWAQAMLAAYRNDAEATLAFLDQAIAANDHRPEFYVVRSYSYRQTESDALNGPADIEKALALYPDYVPALAALAWRNFDKNETGTLRADAEHILALNPNRPEGYDLLLNYFDSVEDDDDKALEQANKLIELYPNHPRPHMLRGYLYLEQNEYEKARVDFEHAREIRQEYLDALFGLSGLAREQEDSDTALELLDQVLALDPRNISARVEQAYIYYALVEDNDPAWEKLNAALEIDPAHPDALMMRATLHMGEGDTGQAYQDFGRILDRFPRHAYVYQLRALAYLQDGNLDRARDDALKSIELDPNAAAGYWALAQIAYAEDDWAEVTRRTTELLDEDSDFAPALAMRGEARFQQNRVEAAIEDLEAAVALEADLERAYINLTYAYFYNSQIPQAIDAAETTLKISEDVDVISEIESFLAFLKTVPPAVDGLHTVVDEDRGYSISYPTSWIQAPIPEEARDTIALVLGTKDGAPGVEISVLAFEGVFGATPQLLAQVVNEAARDIASFEIVERGSVQIAGRTGYFQVFELEAADETGSARIRSKQYYIVRGDLALMIGFRAPVAAYARYVEEAGEIALSLAFLP
jgi:tetratricopeptide (TPR) repeat protein